jgi:hypothetical protein
MTTRSCLVDDGDCIHSGRIRRDLCDRHYGRLMRYGTTDPDRRVTHKLVNGRPDVDMRNVELLLRACRLGTEPAESLPGFARDWLVHELWISGWTDLEIASWTRMTTYTTARIRERLGLAVNVLRGAVA